MNRPDPYIEQLRKEGMDHGERLQDWPEQPDDARTARLARNIMVAGSIAVVCIAAGLIGYVAGWIDG